MLLLHLLLCLDELDGRREERRCEATACTSDEDLGERGLFVIRPYLDLQEKTVRRKEQPVKYRCGGLSPEVGLYISSVLFVQLVLTSGYFLFGVRGADAGRTRGDEMPLKSPRSPSSRVIVASAWKVERYWTFGAGFWKRYFTARDHRLLSLAISAFPVSVGAGLGERDFTSVEWESHDYTRDPCDCAGEKI